MADKVSAQHGQRAPNASASALPELALVQMPTAALLAAVMFQTGKKTEEPQVIRDPASGTVTVKTTRGERQFKQDKSERVEEFTDSRENRSGQKLSTTWTSLRNAEGIPTSTFFTAPPPKFYAVDISKFDSFSRPTSITPAPIRKEVKEGIALISPEQISAIEYRPDSTFITSITRTINALKLYSRESPDQLLQAVGRRPVFTNALQTNYMEKVTARYEYAEDKSLKSVTITAAPEGAVARATSTKWTPPEGATDVRVLPNGDVGYTSAEGKAEVLQLKLDRTQTLVRAGSSNRWDTLYEGKKYGETFGAQQISADGSLASRSFSYQSDGKWRRWNPAAAEAVSESAQPSKLRIRYSVDFPEPKLCTFTDGLSPRIRTSQVGGAYRAPGESYHSTSLEEARSRLEEIIDEHLPLYGSGSVCGSKTEGVREKIKLFMSTLESRAIAVGRLQGRAGPETEKILRALGMPADRAKADGAEQRFAQSVARCYDELSELIETPDSGNQLFSQHFRFQLAVNAMFHLHKAFTIDQGGNPTCQTTIVEIYGSEQEPDQYAKFVKDIALRGTVIFDGKERRIPAGPLQPSRAELSFSLDNAMTNQTRSPVSRLMQVGLINAYRQSQNNFTPYEAGNPWRNGFSIEGAARGWLGYSLPVFGSTVTQQSGHTLLVNGRGPVAQSTLRGAHIQQRASRIEIVGGEPRVIDTPIDNTWGESSRSDGVGSAPWLDQIRKWAEENKVDIGDLF